MMRRLAGRQVGRQVLVTEDLDRGGRDAGFEAERLVGGPLVGRFDLAAGGQDGQLAVGVGEDAAEAELRADLGGSAAEGRVMHHDGARTTNAAPGLGDTVPDRLELGSEIFSLYGWKPGHVDLLGGGPVPLRRAGRGRMTRSTIGGVGARTGRSSSRRPPGGSAQPAEGWLGTPR